MIDDYAKAMELARKMEANLPIPARPTGGFIRAMKAQGGQNRSRPGIADQARVLHG